MKMIPPNITPGEWDMRTDVKTGPAPENNPWYDQWILNSNTRGFMALIEYPYLNTRQAHSLEKLREHREGKEEVAANARAIAALPKLLKALEDELAVLIDYRDRALALMPEKTLFFSRIESIKSALIAAGYTEAAE